MSGKSELFDLELSALAVIVNEHVRWGDMDAFGHMNNAVFFRLFESSRMAYLERINFCDPELNDGLGPILAHTECYFRKPLVYPQSIRIGTRVRTLENDRFTMDYGLFINDDEPVMAACGSGLVICYDYRQNRRATIPPPVAGKIRDVEGPRLMV